MEKTCFHVIAFCVILQKHFLHRCERQIPESVLKVSLCTVASRDGHLQEDESVSPRPIRSEDRFTPERIFTSDLK